jgi:hypothetical protein
MLTPTNRSSDVTQGPMARLDQASPRAALIYHTHPRIVIVPSVEGQLPAPLQSVNSVGAGRPASTASILSRASISTAVSVSTVAPAK